MIFVDSSVFVSYIVVDDFNHQKAVKLIKQIVEGNYEYIFTSDYIFDETTTVTLIRSKSIDTAISAGNYIKESIELIKVDETVFEEAWILFKNQKTSKLSFTDCTNLVIMRTNGIRNIATFDNEFKKFDYVNVVN